MHGTRLIMLLALLILLSCSEEKQVTPLTYPRVFTGEKQKTWVIDRVLVRKKGTADQPIDLSLCELDDRYTFKADEERSFVITNGAIKCEDTEEDIYVEHFWSFVNAGAVLSIAMPRLFGNFIVPFIVMEATKDRLVLEIFADQENTISYQVVMRSIGEQ